MIRFNEDFHSPDDDSEIPDAEIGKRFVVDGVPKNSPGFERAPALENVQVISPEFEGDMRGSDERSEITEDELELASVRQSLFEYTDQESDQHARDYERMNFDPAPVAVRPEAYQVHLDPHVQKMMIRKSDWDNETHVGLSDVFKKVGNFFSSGMKKFIRFIFRTSK